MRILADFIFTVLALGKRGRVIRRMRTAILILALGLLGPLGALAGDGLPRFVSLRSDEVNMRKGPGTQYPVAWVYVRKSLPVEVTAEYEHWRRIRDSEGAEGWVHKSLLSTRRTIMVIGEERRLRDAPGDDAPVVMRAEAGVLGRLLSCRGKWCEVEISGTGAWIPRQHLWGVHGNENVD